MGVMLVRHEPTRVAPVRREIALDLAGHGAAPELVDDVTLVASELVSNAVRHADLAADRDLDVAWTIGRADVLVTVSDGSDAEPRMRVPASDEPTGRGLA